MDKEQIKEKAEDLIEGIKEKFECDEHEDCDGIHLDDKIAEKVKELAKAEGSILDKVLGKVVSRKLLVFATATVLLAQYGLDPDTWGMIAIVYIGGQSVIDAAKTWRHGG
tara:strand:+ start:268 stop:597 length:330 start_codon:yes stop_codon:yes gene_type:complete